MYFCVISKKKTGYDYKTFIIWLDLNILLEKIGPC